MEYILPQCFGHGPVTLIGVHNSGENILFAANDLYGSLVSVLIKSLGKLILAMVIEVGGVDIKNQFPVKVGIRFQATSGDYTILLGQFTRNYTQTVKRAADNKRRYAPGWVHSTCLLRGFPKGAAPHLAHDFAEQSVVCYTLCRRCPENTVAAGEGKGI